jgi:hypothetical protein
MAVPRVDCDCATLRCALREYMLVLTESAISILLILG